MDFRRERGRDAVGSFFRVLQNRVVEETRCKLFIVYCWSVYILGCMCVCAGVRDRVQRNWGANVHWGLFSCWSIVGQAGSQLSVTHTHTPFSSSWLYSSLRKNMTRGLIQMKLASVPSEEDNLMMKGKEKHVGVWKKRRRRTNSWDITVCEIQRDWGGGGVGVFDSRGESCWVGQWWSYIRAVLPSFFYALSVWMWLQSCYLVHFVIPY